MKEELFFISMPLICLLMGLFIGYYHGLIYGLKTNEEKLKAQAKKEWYLKPVWKISDKIEQKTKELK